MDFRIGINLGDVIEEEDSIYGDGVNIAARLEGLAEPGGICISGTAYDHIENKIPLHYDYLGEHQVKNITKPVRVYRARIELETTPSLVPDEKKPEKRRLSRTVIAVIALVVIAGAVTLYQFAIRPSASKTEVASKDKMAFPLPDVPSIAVLPFVNMSGDPKQEFLSDGMTEEIITALSKASNLLVIARNSTFTYKGKAVKVKQVAEEMGVRYVLEGSIQRSGDRIRINAQLIDALTGNHLWAELYDRDLKDLFALQDEITIKILSAIQVKLTEGEQASISDKYYQKYFKGKQGLDCYLKIVEWQKYWQNISVENLRVMRRITEEGMEKCPEVPGFYVGFGFLLLQEVSYGIAKSPQENIEKSFKMAQKALAMDDSLAVAAVAHRLLGNLYLYKREFDKAIAEGYRAVELNPNGARDYNVYAMILDHADRPEEAIPLFQKALRLDPVGSAWTYQFFGEALQNTGRFEEAVSAYKKCLQRAPDSIGPHIGLAATYSLMNREKEARAEAAEVLRRSSNFSVDNYAKNLTYKNQSVIDKRISALRRAGLK